MNLSRRDVMALGGATVATVLLPDRLAAQTPAAGSAADTEALLRLVDPQLRGSFLSNRTIVDAAALPQVRARMAANVPPPLAHPSVVRRLIPGPKGAPDVAIFLINAGAKGPSPRPVLLHLHGGGYVAGSVAGELAMAQQIALDHQCVVVSVDYRLAPETRFPGALEDNYAALRWIAANADELGIDTGRIAVMGTSAGGGHAATLSAAAKDRGEVPIHFQLLLSPMLDDRTGSSRPTPPHIGAFIWTADANRFGWSSLLGVPAGSRHVPEGAVPSRRPDVGGLPPTYIGVGSIDLFVNENIEYAARLVDAGVPVELNVVPGAYHVFFAIKPDADASKQFRGSYARALFHAFASLG